MTVYEIYQTISDGIQAIGDVFILAGYWLMPKTVKWASVSLMFGCATYALWALFIEPVAWPLLFLEVTCFAMSARAFWLNRRSANGLR